MQRTILTLLAGIFIGLSIWSYASRVTSAQKTEDRDVELSLAKDIVKTENRTRAKEGEQIFFWRNTARSFYRTLSANRLEPKGGFPDAR